MKAFVITLNNDKYSNMCADRCEQSAAKYGLKIKRFWGTKKEDAEAEMKRYGLTWTWAGEKNNRHTVCPITGLKQHPYRCSDLRAVKGCSMSHYRLWTKCVEIDEPILILEHDAVFLRPFPEFDFKGICQINDPARCTPKGDYWSRRMTKRGGVGVFPKTRIRKGEEKDIPDGLAGNSAYVIKPFAAGELVTKFHELGMWPNDATMCIQLFPYLQEYYPFITKVIQTRSTTTTINS